MKFLPLDLLGPHLNGSLAKFAGLLPGTSSQASYSVLLRIIHATDQFIQTTGRYNLWIPVP